MPKIQICLNEAFEHFLMQLMLVGHGSLIENISEMIMLSPRSEDIFGPRHSYYYERNESEVLILLEC